MRTLTVTTLALAIFALAGPYAAPGQSLDEPQSHRSPRRAPAPAPPPVSPGLPSASPGDEMPMPVVVTFKAADGATWKVRLTDPG